MSMCLPLSRPNNTWLYYLPEFAHQMFNSGSGKKKKANLQKNKKVQYSNPGWQGDV